MLTLPVNVASTCEMSKCHQLYLYRPLKKQQKIFYLLILKDFYYEYV